MNQCLHCNKQCGAASLFCDECEVLLQNQRRSIAAGQRAGVDVDVSAQPTSPHATVSSTRHAGQVNSENQDISKRITAPQPGVRSPRISQPSIYSVQVNRVEQALNRLSDAARRIAAAEPGTHHKPKISRLSPLHDISAEIQRQSTPLPPQVDQIPFTINNEQKDDLDAGLPDLWPWLNDGDSGEIDADSWSNRTDPLISRHFPDSIEAARIEEEDMRRAAAGGLATFSLPVARKKHVARLRFAFAGLALLAILAITIDSVLVSFVFLNKRPTSSVHGGLPSLTLSAMNVVYGQTVTLHVKQFSASTRVYITRDVNEPVNLNPSSVTVGPDRSTIQVDRNGNADAFMYIESTWDAGFHTIWAEDTKTHYTASTSFRIANAGPTLPPQLIVDDQTIDLGSELQGANSIHPLHMHNGGSGSIIWSANSTQSWLLVSPNQGTFSDSQTISVAGQRADLKPGDYEGSITISSNVGMSAKVLVDMTVRSLPTNAGPVLQVLPAVLSFSAIDGSSNPPSQSLVISNPGSRPLHWSLLNDVSSGSQSGLPARGGASNWLSTDHTTGTVVPRATSTVEVTVQIQNLLPGSYTGTLVLTADGGAINSPQSINISLTVQVPCSLQLSTNMLSFTAVSGQGSPNTQALSLSANASCPGLVSWSASTSDPWLTISSTNYQLKGMSSTTATVGVNVNGLQTGVTYDGVINVTLAQNTQSVVVQLIIQPPPPPGAPILVVSPMNVNFSLTQGQPAPPSQIVSITNTGESALYWSQLPQMLGSFWLGAFPKGGVIQPKQTAQLFVNVRTTGLSAGIFNGTITINGRDANGNTASGSPQVITVNLNLQAPCTLAPPAAGVLAFTATTGGSNPVSQIQSFNASGNCAWPVAWNVSGQPSWLNLSSSSGTFAGGGQSSLLTVAPITAGLAPGTYTAQLAISATDSASMTLTGSPQSFTVSFTVQVPCSLQVPSGLNFTATQGQSPPSQLLNISESGSCALPVAWGASITSTNTSWLGFPAPSGTDSGNGSSAAISINTAGLAPGQYKGVVTVSASDNFGNSLQGSPQTVPITLIVTGFTISGTVNACADSACSTSAPLANATLVLTDNSGKQFSATADASGNYTFNGVALGSCTIAASGSNGATNYTGNSSLTVSGNQTGITVKTY